MSKELNKNQIKAEEIIKTLQTRLKQKNLENFGLKRKIERLENKIKELKDDAK